MADPTHLELVGRVALAALLGATLGLEREARGKVAGMRTHALVAVGAALFSITGSYGFEGPANDVDPTRIAAQVATGIGFIGAGAIIRTGGSVRGLTTAATLWVAAAFGVAVAAGLYVESAGAAVLVLVIVVLLQLLKPYVSRNRRRSVTVVYEEGHGVLARLIRNLGDNGAVVRDIRIDEEAVPGCRSVTIDVLAGGDDGLDAVVGDLRTETGIVRAAHWHVGPSGPRHPSAPDLA